MIRRHPPRPRGQHQDFHFFAGTQRPNSFEPPSFPPAAIRRESPPRESIATEGPDHPSTSAPAEPASLSPAASSAVRQSIEFLANVNDPRELMGKQRPAFMDELDALAASTRNPSSRAPEESTPSERPKTRQPAKPRRRSASVSRPQPLSERSSADRHERRCTICAHPDRADIEADFIEWAAPGEIAKEYGVSRIAVYRHARAVGLFARRDRNLRFALGRLIEHADQVWPTPDSIVRAIHAFARINDQGEWVEPPAHVVVSSGGVRREAAAPPSRRPVAIQLDSPALASVINLSKDSETQRVLTGTPVRLECDANC